MADHRAYWTALAEKGAAIVFGPVADPGGAWGLGVLAVEDEKEARVITSHDPVIKSAIGASYKILPMPKLATGKNRDTSHFS